MYKIKIYCDWNLLVDFESERQVELFVDNSWKLGVPTSGLKRLWKFWEPVVSLKILYVCEPQSIFPNLVEVAVKKQLRFDYILTHNDTILKNCKNAVLFEFGGTWIPDEYAFKEKQFSISTIVGNKTATDGHILRHQIWERQNEITTPKRFYKSRHGGPQSFPNNPILTGPKEPLFDSQFHLAIENTRLKYYFTEKLLDCFRTKTVPIYWGCPNIGDYFNTAGMIIVNNSDEIVAACNSLNDQTYDRLLGAIEDNYKLADKYKDLSSRLKHKIGELLK